MVQETMYSIIPLLIIIVPLLSGIVIFLAGSKTGKAFVSYAGIKETAVGDQSVSLPDDQSAPIRNLMLMVGTLVPFALTLYLYSFINRGMVVVSKLDILPPLGLSFRVDTLGMYMSLVFTFFGFIIVLYSIGYMKGDPLPRRFFGFLMLVYAGSLGVVLAGDLFSLFLFFEFMSIMYFVLVVHDGTTEAVDAGVKFLFMTIIAGISLFLAVVIVYRESGSLALDTPGLIHDVSTLSLLAFIGFVIAFGTKAAMFPLHFWMPDAYSLAPLPAATLSSAIMLKTGAYGLIRVFYNIFGVDFWQTVPWDNVLMVIAAFTILFGSVLAIAQDDLIRRLAYSGIAQLGYIILGITILTPSALVGAAYHITAHAFMKGCLLLCAGAFVLGTGNRSISKMKGIGYQFPVTMLAFAVASVTAVGIPPFNIFLTKWQLSLGALEINQPFLVLILLISSLLNAAYYLPIVYYAFWGKRENANLEEAGSRKFEMGKLLEPSLFMLIPIIFLAVGCIIFMVSPRNLPLELVQSLTAALFSGR